MARASLAAVGGNANAGIWELDAGGAVADAGARCGDFLPASHARSEGWRTMVIRAQTSGEILGMATYMRIREAHGGVEIGCVAFGPKLKRTPEATRGARR